MTSEVSKILKGARIISPKDSIDDVLDIKIKNSVVVEIASNIEGDGIDCSGKVIVPSFVDMHCHLREPGFEYKETIETGIHSAIAGGFGAICPMANTNPVADCPEVIKFELSKAAEIGKNIVFPISAASKGLLGKELVDFKAQKQAGAVAFSDDGKPFVEVDLFKKALESGELVISHPEPEAQAVERELEVFRQTGGRLHFAHISTEKAVDLIREAKKSGLSVTCETAPHYFTFTHENVTEDGRFKMNPPLVLKEDVDAVIEGLKDGTIDCIATDHAPHSLEEKQKPFEEAPFGIIGFETALGASFRLVENGHLTLTQLVEKMSTNPAKILALKGYGEIKVGLNANLTVADFGSKYKVRENEFRSKCKISPFDGLEFKGKVIFTVINGEIYN